MKKFLLITVFSGLAVYASAQSLSYKPFKLDLNFGPDISFYGNGTSTNGLGISMHAHYLASDNFAIGLRIEQGYFYHTTNDALNTFVNVFSFGLENMTTTTSFCASGEYYLSNGKVRPFIGGGVGFFSPDRINTNSDGTDNAKLVPGSTQFGFFPEAGFEAGHFRMSADYNVAGNNSDYLALKFGFFFGGGKIKK